MDALSAQPAWAVVLAGVGLLITPQASACLAMWLYAAFLRPGKPLRRRYDEWAVITGATDGIGRAMAFCFVAARLHLVLVDRSPDKIAAVSKEIRAKHPRAEAEYFAVKFLSLPDAQKPLVAAIDGIALGGGLEVAMVYLGCIIKLCFNLLGFIYFNLASFLEWESQNFSLSLY
ncbi:hypothetical protein GUJ93_ZPchr0012g20344 [Zizania palustris]|uniref:Uncharacterized protein n=1 Tax=Zizania palustris TaxID=103762 RepID=A0A8J5WR79_ZIZPA|nr:hypothetical protein GUJ93_ZPchr0012g20344 [Zizania palustris]